MITDRYPPEARSAAALFQDMAEALAKRNHEIYVLTQMPTDYVPKKDQVKNKSFFTNTVQEGGVTVIRVRGISSLSTSIFQKIFHQIILAISFVIVAFRVPSPNVILVYSPPLLLVAMTAFYCAWKKIPYVMNLHDIYPRTAIQLGLLKNRVIIWGTQKLEAFSYKKAKIIVVPAPGSKKILIGENGIPSSKIYFVPNWVDTKVFKPGPKENTFREKHGLGSQFVISYAGLMGFAQDLSTIIECARNFQSQSQFTFLLIGDGVYAEKWKKMASGLKNIMFLPMLSESDYFDALRASDICLVPLIETLSSPAIPGKIQSIMAVERPIIAIVPSSGDAANLIFESKSGYVVTPGNVKELERVIGLIKEKPEIGEEMGKNGRKYAEEHFVLEKAASSYENILQKAISECN